MSQWPMCVLTINHLSRLILLYYHQRKRYKWDQHKHEVPLHCEFCIHVKSDNRVSHLRELKVECCWKRCHQFFSSWSKSDREIKKQHYTNNTSLKIWQMLISTLETISMTKDQTSPEVRYSINKFNFKLK